MKNDTPANFLEMLAYFISLQIEDHKVVYVGTGLPMVVLSGKTTAERICNDFC